MWEKRDVSRGSWHVLDLVCPVATCVQSIPACTKNDRQCGVLIRRSIGICNHCRVSRNALTSVYQVELGKGILRYLSICFHGARSAMDRKQPWRHRYVITRAAVNLSAPELRP